MRNLFLLLLIIVLAMPVFSNPQPEAEVIRISAYPPEIGIVFNMLEDTLDLSGFSIFTTGGTATINPGTVLYYNDELPLFFTLDSSNTSGFVINPEGDTVYTDIEVFPGYPFMYMPCRFGNLGNTPPPIKGSALTEGFYNTSNYPDIGGYCLMFSFADWQPGYTDIVINELSVNSTWGTGGNFIELYNTSDTEISLAGYKIVCDTIYELPSNAMIPAYGFYVIDESNYPSAFGIDTDIDNIYLINPNFNWPFYKSRLVDQVGWSSNHGENVSYMRYPDGDADSSRCMEDFLGYNDETSTTFENGFPSRGAANRHDCPGFVIIAARADSLDEGTVKLTWTNPIWDDHFDYSILVKSMEGYATSPNDGTILYEGTGQQFVDMFVDPGTPSYYTVFARDLSGEYSTPTNESRDYIFFNSAGVEEANLPSNIGMLNCYPNPFNAQTKISFSLASADDVKLTIYDITGRLCETIANNYFLAGEHSVSWNAANFSSGIYFVKLNTSREIYSEKLVLIK